MAEEKEKKGKKQGTSGKKTGWWILLILIGVLILAAAGLGIYAAGYDGIFPNTYIGECNVGGKSPEEALELVKEAYTREQFAGESVTLVCKGDKTELDLDALEAAFDHQASVDAAMKASQGGNVLAKAWNLTGRLFTRRVITPILSYNAEVLENAVVQVAGKYEKEPAECTYEIKKDQVIVYDKKDGKKVDREGLVKTLQENLCRGEFSDIPAEPVAITPKSLKLDEFYRELTAPPAEASYEKGEDGVIRVRPGKYQCKVEKSVVKAALDALETGTEEKVTFPVTTTAPKKTTEDLTQQLYQDVLGSYTTYYSGSAARNSNVELAASRINGTEMMPGDEFSYDKTILPRTYDNGYQAAPVYVGNKVESGLGGGICQPSSTLYCAALYANLEILERHNHSMLVGYMPAGLDATIAEGYLDMRFKNSTAYPIKIEAIASGGKLTFNILGYNPENISVELVRAGGGFHYTATRVVYRDGKEIHREKLDSSIYSPKETEEPEKKEKQEEKEKPGEETPPAGEQAPSETPPEQAPAPAPAEPAPAPAPTPEPTPVPAPTPVTDEG